VPTIPEPTSRKSVTLPDTLWETIGQYRYYRQIPTEAEAIRQLIQAGLNSGPTIKTVIDVVTRKTKFVPGPLDEHRGSPFLVIDFLAAQIGRNNPALSGDQSQALAQQIFTRAQEATGDLDAAISLLNVDWRSFL
jgi:hypothetical protein